MDRTGWRRAMTGAAALALAGGTAWGSEAKELELLRAQLAALEARLLELEAREAATAEKVAETAETVETRVVTRGTAPGTFMIPGTNTSVEISGFVKGDFIYDVNESPGGDLFVPEAITVGESGPGVDDENRFRAHARQSKLVIRATSPSAYGPVKALFEGDFFGVGGTELFSNSASFRIRHLYGEVGPLGGGQYWSNFMTIEAYPRTVDFQGPAGLLFIRQAQLRWTEAIDENLTVIASLENSEFTGRIDTNPDPTAIGFAPFGETTAGSLAGINAGLDVAPDAIVSAIWKDDWGLVRGSVVARRFGDQGGSEGGAFGWGVNVGGRWDTPWTGGNLRATLTYGDGVGRYIVNGTLQDAIIDDQGNYDTVRALGFHGQVQQKVGEHLTVGLAYGRMQVFDTFVDTDLEAVQTVHASAFYALTDRVTLGAEAIWGQRQNADDQSDSAVRIQTAVQVSF